MAIRVLIIDDSPFMRKALTRMLSSDDRIEVVAAAPDGIAGLELIEETKPDVVTLDVKMPRMDGLETLKRIMATNPVPVLMLSSYTHEGGELTLKALEEGAVDFIDKSSTQNMMDILGISNALIQKVTTIAGIDHARLEVPRNNDRPAEQPTKRQSFTSPKIDRLFKAPNKAPTPDATAATFPVFIIAASTGGPAAIGEFVPKISAGFRGSIVLVQHMPPGFTKTLAQRLDVNSQLRVLEGEDGHRLAPGRVYLARAGMHCVVVKNGAFIELRLKPGAPDAIHVPSADVTMASAAVSCPGYSHAVVLTGMGQDGLAGARAIAEKGGIVAAESAKSALLDGMPRAVREAGVAQQIVTLSDLPAWLEDTAQEEFDRLNSN